MLEPSGDDDDDGSAKRLSEDVVGMLSLGICCIDNALSICCCVSSMVSILLIIAMIA